MVYDGVKTVAAAGTRERLTSTGNSAAWIFVQAINTNTGAVFVGGSTIATGRGVRLLSSEGFMIPYIGAPAPYNTYDVYVDSAVNGEGVTFLYGR